MITKRKLMIMLLFSFVIVSSISAISAADSDVADVQTIDDAQLNLDDCDVQAVDEDVKLEQSDSSLKASGGNGASDFDDQLTNGEEKNKTVIHAENITAFPNEGKIVAGLSDEEGTPLEGLNISLEVENTKLSFKTNGSGQVCFNVSDFNLGIGNYTGTLKFEGNEQYNASNLTIDIKVRTLNSTITAENITYIYSEPKALIITLRDSEGNPIENATVKMDIDVSDIQGMELKTNSTGQAAFNLKDKLAVGTYVGRFRFEGTTRYGGCDAVINITVKDRISTKICADNITTFPEEGKIVAKLVDGDGNPLEGLNITLVVEHVNRNFATNSSGEVYFNVSGFNLGEGNYKGKLAFKGNDIYNASNLTIDIRLRTLNSTISADNLTFIYCESGVLIISLKDSEGNPIENASIYMDVQVSYIHEYLTTNSTGEAAFNFTGKLEIKKYVAYLSFAKTNRYNASSLAVDITVTKVPTTVNATNVTCDFGDVEYLNVTLKDKYNNTLANQTITLQLNSKTLYNITNDTGVAQFLIDFAPKVYTATITYSGNATHEASSVTVTIIVNEIREKIVISQYSFNSVYNVGKNIVVTLKDDHGKGIANKEFIVDFNGKKVNYKTDANGQIKIPISSLVPNTYKGHLTFLGDNVYQPAEFDITLTVKKATPYLFASKKKFNKKTKIKKYKVTLKTNKNAPMKKVKLYLKVKGKTYTAKTNKKGQAIFKIKKLTRKGSYKAVITYKGNNCYNKVVKKAKIRVR